VGGGGRRLHPRRRGTRRLQFGLVPRRVIVMEIVGRRRRRRKVQIARLGLSLPAAVAVQRTAVAVRARTGRKVSTEQVTVTGVSTHRLVGEVMRLMQRWLNLGR